MRSAGGKGGAGIAHRVAFGATGKTKETDERRGGPGLEGGMHLSCASPAPKPGSWGQRLGGETKQPGGGRGKD
jgi:hypothetical protein